MNSARSVFLRVPGRGLKVLSLDGGDDGSARIAAYLQTECGVVDYWLDCQPHSDTIRVRLRLRGGKGGFGSNLRSQGNKLSRRRTGVESCRDLSGRRIRTTNQARLIEEYLARRPEMEQRREKEVREKMLRTVEAANRRPVFSDVDYLKTARETVDAVEAAVYEALLGDTDSEHEDGAGDEDEANDAGDVANNETGKNKDKLEPKKGRASRSTRK